MTTDNEYCNRGVPTYPNTPAVIVNDAAALIALTPYLRYDVTTYTGVYNQIPGLQIGYRSGADLSRFCCVKFYR